MEHNDLYDNKLNQNRCCPKQNAPFIGCYRARAQGDACNFSMSNYLDLPFV